MDPMDDRTRLSRRALGSTFLWTDDNLSTQYLFDKLDRQQLDRLTRLPQLWPGVLFQGF